MKRKIDPKFVKAIETACESALLRHGFRRLRRDGLVWDLSSDFLGWTGLNIGKHVDFVRINPSIGVHCIPVMRLVAQLAGESYQLGRYATIATHLGEVCPDEDSFEFSSEADIEAESERLASLLRTQGVSFMESHASFRAILPMVEKRVPSLGGYPQRMAAILYLMGQREAARKFVLERQAEYETDPSIRVNFDRFAGPFLKLLSLP